MFMTGDTLARGMAKAQFPPAGGNVTQSHWDAIFEDFDVEKYRRDADSQKAGDAGSRTRKGKRNR